MLSFDLCKYHIQKWPHSSHKCVVCQGDCVEGMALHSWFEWGMVGARRCFRDDILNKETEGQRGDMVSSPQKGEEGFICLKNKPTFALRTTFRWLTSAWGQRYSAFRILPHLAPSDTALASLPEWSSKFPISPQITKPQELCQST